MLLMQNLVEQLKELINEKYINATTAEGKKTGIVGFLSSPNAELAKLKRASAETFLSDIKNIAQGKFPGKDLTSKLSDKSISVEKFTSIEHQHKAIKETLETRITTEKQAIAELRKKYNESVGTYDGLLDVCYYMVATEIAIIAKHAKAFDTIAAKNKDRREVRKSSTSDTREPVKDDLVSTNFREELTVLLCKQFMKIKIDQYYFDAPKAWTDTDRATKFPSNDVRDRLLEMIVCNLARLYEVQDKAFSEQQFTSALTINIMQYLLTIEEDHRYPSTEIRNAILKIQFEITTPWLKTWDASLKYKNGHIAHSDKKVPPRTETPDASASSAKKDMAIPLQLSDRGRSVSAEAGATRKDSKDGKGKSKAATDKTAEADVPIADGAQTLNANGLETGAEADTEIGADRAAESVNAQGRKFR